MDKQSVRISVDRFYYAKLTKDDDFETIYDTPVHLPGVNVVALRTNSAIGSFYADDGVFETYFVEGDRDLQVSFSGLSNEVVGTLTGTDYQSGLLVDKKDDSPPYAAIGFRTQKSNGSYRYVWLYKGRFAKADIDGYTKSAVLSPQPDVYTFKAINRVHDGAWRRMLDSDDQNLSAGLTEGVLSDEASGWFSSPDFDPSGI